MNKDQAIGELRSQIDAIPNVQAAGRLSSVFTGWHRDATVTVAHVFGDDHRNVGEFRSISYTPAVWGSSGSSELFDRRFQEGLANARAVLESMVSEIERFWPSSESSRTERQETESEAPEEFDIAIICALHQPELDKVFRVSGVEWSALETSASDPHTYHRSLMRTEDGSQVRVVAAAPNHMGLAASGVLATKVIWRFRPRLVVMIGIAAGIRHGSQGFGDIIAADQTFDYGSGKLSSRAGSVEFVPDPRPHAIATRALARLREWQRQGRTLDEIVRAWPARRPQTELRLHVGPLGSGAAVVNAQETVDEILRHWRKAAGLEMEAFAVHSACLEAIEPSPIFLCFKSICDFAAEKTDDWQDYAAFTAASLALKFVLAEYSTLCMEPKR